MRSRIVVLVSLAMTTTVLVTAFLGCGPIRECTLSPIEIEELKSDIRDLDAELVLARERLAEEQERLAGWEKRRADREAEMPGLRAELTRLKKASGVTVKVREKSALEEQPSLESLLDN